MGVGVGARVGIGSGSGVAVGRGSEHMANKRRSRFTITSTDCEKGEVPSGKSPAQVKNSPSHRAVTSTTVPLRYVRSSLAGIEFICPWFEGKIEVSRRKRPNEISTAPTIGVSLSDASGGAASTGVAGGAGTANGTGTCTEDGSETVEEAGPVLVVGVARSRVCGAPAKELAFSVGME